MSHKKRNLIGRIVVTVIMVAFGLLCIFPFIWMISTSFKNEVDVMEFPIRIIPKVWNFTNYHEVWFESNFPMYYLNSIKVTGLTLLGDIILTTTAAYAFARLRFRGKEVIFSLYLATMMVPVQVMLLPKYIYFGWMNINNNHLALILPGIFSAFGVFLMRGFFESIPKEMSEAACIDGAGHFRTFLQVILPLAKPGITTEILFAFSWCWNDYINPLIFINSDKLFTLTIGLQRFQESSSTHYALIMAGATVSLLPLIVVFLFAQKYFIESFANVGVKG